MATLCISGLAIIKAGANVSASVPDTSWDSWIEEAEAQLSTFSRYDWVGNFATIETFFKPILQAFCGDLAAIHGIKYDMSGYTSRIEAEDLINVLRDEVLRIAQLLRDQKGVTFGKG